MSNSPTTKLCAVCNKLLPIDKFELVGKGYPRSLCRKCRDEQRFKDVSSTPKTYLKLLCTQLKSSRRNQDIDFFITPDDLYEIWNRQGGRCALSGVVMTHQRGGKSADGKKRDFNASIDRIDPAGGYTPSNVQLVSTRVNTMKHTLTEDMFRWWIRTIYEHKSG